MTKKQKGLGRGLEALLGPSNNQADEQLVAIGADNNSMAMHNRDGAAANDLPSELFLEQLQAGEYQPRTRMDEGALYELAESIKAQGIMQPILVRPLKAPINQNDAREGNTADLPIRYEIIAGERRFRAAKLAGLSKIPVLVRQVDNEAAAAMALIENIQREDLNPLEEAQGIQRLVKEFGMTHEGAAQAVGRSRSAASNLLRLLNLSEPVQTMLMAGDLDMGHARSLLALDKAMQITAANQIVAKALSVREAENLVKKISKDTAAVKTIPAPSKKDKSGDIKRVEQSLSDLLSSTVEIRIKKRVKLNGKMEDQGEVSIAFSSLEELNQLIRRLEAGDTTVQ